MHSDICEFLSWLTLAAWVCIQTQLIIVIFISVAVDVYFD